MEVRPAVRRWHRAPWQPHHACAAARAAAAQPPATSAPSTVSSPTCAAAAPPPDSTLELEDGEWQVVPSCNQKRWQRKRQQQKSTSASASTRTAEGSRQVDGHSAAVNNQPPSPDGKSMAAGIRGSGSQAGGRRAAAKGPGKKTPGSRAVAPKVVQGKENNSRGNGSSGTAKGASRAPSPFLAQPPTLRESSTAAAASRASSRSALPPPFDPLSSWSPSQHCLTSTCQRRCTAALRAAEKRCVGGPASNCMP